MAEAYFVTGTDTGVGKTLVSTALLLAAGARGQRTLGLKPVASGATWQHGRLRNDDAIALRAASTVAIGYEDCNPVVLEPPIAPHLAAAVAGVDLQAAGLALHCRRVLGTPHDFAVVEGAGGWRVPLNAQETLADVARLLQLPVILVVGLRLGCINHALLTAEAIRHDGLRLAGWVASQVDAEMPRVADNLISLERRLAAPRLGFIPWRDGVDPAWARERLDLDLLHKA